MRMNSILWVGVWVLASSAACQLLSPPEPIRDHLQISLEVDRTVLQPGDTARIEVTLRSLRDEPMRIDVQEGETCSWRVTVREPAGVKYPEVWGIRPAGRWTCPEPDPMSITLGPREVRQMGVVLWDGYVLDSDVIEPPHWLEADTYRMVALFSPHTVVMGGEEYEAEPLVSEQILIEINPAP